MKTLLIVAAAVAALLIIFAVCASAALFRYAVCRPAEGAGETQKKSAKPIRGLELATEQYVKKVDEMRAEREWFESMKPETVELVSYDGLRLRAQLLTADNAIGSVLLMHGYHSTGPRDFSLVLRLYHELGYNILLPSQRAAGDSQGKYITFGVRERFDCRDWAHILASRFGAELPLFLGGMSLGSATVLMSAGLDLPENTAGIIADCGFTSPWDEMKHVLISFFGLPVFPFMYMADMMTRLFAGFGLKEYSTLTAMETNKIPVLFIHGGGDGFVPTEMSRRNYDACTAEKELLIIPGASHGMSYLVEPERCEKYLREFLKKHGGGGV